MIGREHDHDIVAPDAVAQALEEPAEIPIQPQHLIVDFTGVRPIGVADGIGGRQAADRRALLVGDVDHHEVLHVRHAADADRVALGAHDGVGPHRRAGADGDAPVELRAGRSPDARVDVLHRAPIARDVASHDSARAAR